MLIWWSKPRLNKQNAQQQTIKLNVSIKFGTKTSCERDKNNYPERKQLNYVPNNHVS